MEGMSKNVDRHGWPTTKNLKKYWLKHPKAVPQETKFGPNVKDSKISNLEFFSWKYYFGHTKVLYMPRCSSGYHQFFFKFRFSSRQSQSQQKLAKKITHFTIQFCSKCFTRFMNHNSFHIENDMLLQHSQKPFWLYKFPTNMFLFGVWKNVCTAPFHSWRTLKANVCILLYISLRRFLFQRRSKVLSGKGWDGEAGWIIFLRGLAVWA